MIEFEKMKIHDLEKIKKDLYKLYDNFWSYEILKSEIENNNNYYLVLKQDKTIIGFGGFKKILDNAEIMNIVIRKDMRNKGYSKLIVQELLNLAKKLKIVTISLEVNTQNKYAIKLYEHFKFKVINIRKKYYNNIDDAIIMYLNL